MERIYKMKVRIHMQGGSQIIGELNSFAVCNDATWANLSECEPGPSLQSLSLDHVKFIRPEKPVGFAVQFVPEEKPEHRRGIGHDETYG
jgi:hypothetical protein